MRTRGHCQCRPLIHHRRHPARWNEEQWARHARHLWTELNAWGAQNKLTSLLSSFNGPQHLKMPDILDLSIMGAACFEWLRTRKLPCRVALLPNGMGSIEALLQDAYRSFSSRGDLTSEQSELAATKAELAATKAALAAFKASTSWRITEPLRQVMTLIR
jgi:hypothetical protein